MKSFPANGSGFSALAAFSRGAVDGVCEVPGITRGRWLEGIPRASGVAAAAVLFIVFLLEPATLFIVFF